MIDSNSKKRQRRMAREPKADATADPQEPGNKDLPSQDDIAPGQRKKPSKTEVVLLLLKRAEGVTLHDLVEATGWLPHTARAALTGLKKKGHIVQRSKVDGVSRYTVVEAASR